jgi:hypothetical protein
MYSATFLNNFFIQLEAAARCDPDMVAFNVTKALLAGSFMKVWLN